MLNGAAVFLIIGLAAALFGFSGIFAVAVTVAKVLFLVCLVQFVLSLVAGAFRRPSLHRTD